MFADFYKRKQEDRMFDRLAKLLGVKYSVEELTELVASMSGPKRKPRGKNGKKTEPAKDIFIPHVLLTNPQSIEVLKNVAKGMKLKTSNSADLSTWDMETYRNFMDASIRKAANTLLQQEKEDSQNQTAE